MNEEIKDSSFELNDGEDHFVFHHVGTFMNKPTIHINLPGQDSGSKDSGFDAEAEAVVEDAASCDEILYENHVFTHKYASYAKMKRLREQIRKCLATDDKEETANLIDPTEKVQWVIVYGLLVVYKMIEDKKGAPTKFLRQMHTFFPDLVPEPDEKWVKSLSAELKLWRDPSGAFLPFGQWSMNCNIYQKNKRRRVTAIAQHIKPFIAEAM